MKAWWLKRSGSERILLVVCALVIVGAAVLVALPSGPSRQGTLLAAGEARRRYDARLKEKLATESESDRVRGVTVASTYSERPDKVIPVVLGDLQKIADASGIHLREIKPLRPRKVGTLTKVPVTVRFQCTFAQSIPFLYRLEDPTGKLVAEKVNVTTSDAKSQTVDVEVEVALFTRGAADTVRPAARDGLRS